MLVDDQMILLGFFKYPFGQFQIFLQVFIQDFQQYCLGLFEIASQGNVNFLLIPDIIKSDGIVGLGIHKNLTVGHVNHPAGTVICIHPIANFQNGKLKQTEVVQVEWAKDENGRWMMNEVEGTTQLIDTDLVLLSMGFTQPVHNGLLDALSVEYDPRGNVKVNELKQTTVEKIFAAGDAEKGASLVVHAIEAGKVAARGVDAFLRGE